jgi:hypothetical protein
VDTTIRRDEFEKLWLKTTPSEMAAKYGISRMAIYYRAKSFGLPTRAEIEESLESPTAEEILERAAEVRKRWSHEEEQKRLVGNRGTGRKWTAPEIRVGEIESPSFSRI